MEEKKPVVVALEGIIGSTKSTTLAALAEQLRAAGYKVSVVEEPVEKWKESGILRRFYGDTKRWAYHFQTQAFHDRVRENIRVRESDAGSDFVLMERSPYSDTLFMTLLHKAGLVDDLEMASYWSWWSLWHRIMPYEIDLVIYIRPGVDSCMAKVQSRARAGESAVDRDYQVKLEEEHDRLFLGRSEELCPVEMPDGKRVRRAIWSNQGRDLRTDERAQRDLAELFLSWTSRLPIAE